MIDNNAEQTFSVLFSEQKQGALAVVGAYPSADILVPPAAMIGYGPSAPLAVGRVLYGVHDDRPALLRILSKGFLPFTPQRRSGETPHAVPCCHAEVLSDIALGQSEVTSCKEGISLAWITLSDKGALGDRQDESGPIIEESIGAAIPLARSQGYLLPDAPDRLRALVLDLACHQGFDLIISTGGTGLNPRDTTPEAVLPLLSRRLPGFEQAMMAASLQKTPNAVVSRALAGTIDQSLLLCLPGSKKAVKENLASVIPALEHALSKLQGDTADCGPPALL